ncbi:MAG TPA: valine--tRNA ligase [Phycisphaerales bacterium]|nr:valine--tRNA ligase [Phycisphaerales bacterium]
MNPDAPTTSKPAKAAAPTPPSGAAAPSPEPGSKAYQPAAAEPRISARWAASGAFHADPARVLSGEKKPFCILIPPPNVTGALHLGHALNNTLQDILTRAHRMMGYEALWMPGTDHAGIATQAVVERRLKKEQNKTRKDFTREQFIALVQEWKDEYEARITGQLKAMGCSCDYDRQRFTMDDICARAVREAFFRLFKDGLIYRGKRLVNWDPALQTAVADDECYEEEHDAFFYYLRYPLVHPQAGKNPGSDAQPVTWDELAARGYPGASQNPADEPAWITVATTRPETYLGDTAVAVNPKDHRAKALRGLFVELPLVGRVIPIVEDDYVVLPAALWADPEEAKNDPKAQYATGFLKVTPAHDQNDYELGIRHGLPMVNVFAPDASISDKHGWSEPTEIEGAHVFLHKTREEARKLVLREFEARGLLEKPRPYRHTLTHSDRTKAVIEPYLSDQWYVRVTDDKLSGAANRALVPEQRSAGGAAAHSARPRPLDAPSKGLEGLSKGLELNSKGLETLSKGLDAPSKGLGSLSKGLESLPKGLETPSKGLDAPSKGLGTSSKGSETASMAASGASESENARMNASGDGSMRFSPARYAKTYEQWHDNIRDWCISRQLWWGHRIAVWGHPRLDAAAFAGVAEFCDDPDLAGFERYTGWNVERLFNESDSEVLGIHIPSEPFFVCVKPGRPDLEGKLEAAGFTQDPDVLDTWFSSALWPLSTMGWPDPAQSPQTAGLLEAFNPTTVLSTAREIITLWVSRMVMMNRYFLPAGTSPSRERGTGRAGDSSSACAVGSYPPGTGPVPFHNVFIHAVVQDGEGRKMSKSLNNGVDPLDIIESHGADAMRFTLAQMTTQTQDIRMPVRKDPKTGKNSSEKFDAGRNFCNKLWNASRFAMAILQRASGVSQRGEAADAEETTSRSRERLSLTDRWMLSRLAKATRACEGSLANYEFSDYCQTLYQLLWWDYCDWYLEAIKPTVDADANQRAVLRTALDVILRLLHPVAPFITETIHEQLRALGTPTLRGGSSGDASTAEAATESRGTRSKPATESRGTRGEPATESRGTRPIPGITLETRDLLCSSSWPAIDASLIDEQAEAEFESLRELINAIRNVRAEHQVLPKRRITLHCSEAAAKRISAAAPGLVENLAGLEAIGTTKPASGVPAVAFRAGGEDMHLTNLADAIDAGAEKDRLTKQLETQRKSEAALAGRLNNPGYADKAPAKLVEESRAQLAKIRAEIAAIEAKLKAM